MKMNFKIESSKRSKKSLLNQVEKKVVELQRKVSEQASQKKKFDFNYFSFISQLFFFPTPNLITSITKTHVISSTHSIQHSNI